MGCKEFVMLVHANCRNPAGYTYWSRDVKPTVAENPSAVKYAGLSRSRLYELLAQGRIKSICLKSHTGALRGVRLVDRGVDRSIHGKPTGSRLKTLSWRGMRNVRAERPHWEAATGPLSLLLAALQI